MISTNCRSSANCSLQRAILLFLVELLCWLAESVIGYDFLRPVNCLSDEVGSGQDEEVDWLAGETIELAENLLILVNGLSEDVDGGLEGCAGLVWETD